MPEQWQSSLCSNICGGDCSTCLGSWFCSPFLFGRAAQRVRNYPSGDTSQIYTCDGNCGLFWISRYALMCWLPMAFKREELRERFGIEGHLCRDMLVSCFCMPCALSQMDTEMKRRAEKAQPKALVAYPVQTQGMVYQQPDQQQQPHVQQKLALPAHPQEMVHQQPEQQLLSVQLQPTA